MITRSNTLNLCLDSFVYSPNKRTISLSEVGQISETTCRICLEPCPYIQLCQCRGSTMAHVECLKQYIVKGQGNMKNKSKCQLCGSNYSLTFDKKCKFSCENGWSQIRSSVLSSLMFVIFSLLTVVYIVYCSYINGRGELDDNLQLVLLIIGVCMILVVLIVLLRWVYLYLFVTVYTLLDIEPAKKKPLVEITQDNLNQSQQHLK